VPAAAAPAPLVHRVGCGCRVWHLEKAWRLVRVRLTVGEHGADCTVTRAARSRRAREAASSSGLSLPRSRRLSGGGADAR
jgi:hypothetical protein